VKELDLLLNRSNLGLDKEDLIGVEATFGESVLKLINLRLLLGNGKDDTVNPLLESSPAGKSILVTNNVGLGLHELLAEFLKLSFIQARLKESSLNLNKSLLGGLELSLKTSLATLAARELRGSGLLRLLGLPRLPGLSGLALKLAKLPLSTTQVSLGLTNATLEALGSRRVGASFGDLVLKSGEFGFETSNLSFKAMDTLGLVSSALSLDASTELLDLSSEGVPALFTNIGASKLGTKSFKFSTILGKFGLHELNPGSLLVGLTIEETKQSPGVLKSGLGLDES